MAHLKKTIYGNVKVNGPTSLPLCQSENPEFESCQRLTVLFTLYKATKFLSQALESPNTSSTFRPS